jgi:hypothetical protein
MKKFLIFSLIAFLGTQLSAQKAKKAKIKLDKEAIYSLAGCYKVSFEFAETFSPDSNYKYHDRKYDWGIEYVFVEEETDKMISLQHILIVNDTFIVKHWRQDWVYENDVLKVYDKNNKWNTLNLTKEQYQGTWTQKVYQVDESPRYEGYGTWVHVDGKSLWRSTTDAPLPRREFTKRSDYNVMRRHSTIQITPYGWLLEQDNEKIVKGDNKTEKLICWEKGFEKFTKGNFNCQPAIDWWEKNKKYWDDVRTVWLSTLNNNQSIELKKKVDEKPLFMHLFGLGDELSKNETYNSKEARAKIELIIKNFIVKS